MSVKVGVIGLGVGRRHIRCFESHDDCRVTAICDQDEELMAVVSAEYPRCKTHATAGELIADPDVSAVSIASYDNHHFEHCQLAIEAGKHVFVEKPVCLSREEMGGIKRLLKENPHIQFSSNHVLRLSSRFRELKEKIDSGDFGDIYYLEGDYQYGRLQKIVNGWRGRIPFYSVVYGGAVHMVDLLLWLSGGKVDEVSAYGNRISSQGTQFQYNDMVVALLKFGNGVVAKVSANFGAQRPHFHAVEVHGTRKLFVNRYEEGEYWEDTEKGSEPVITTTQYKDYHKVNLIRGFVDQILGRGRAMIQPDDVFRTMAVCFAIEESVASGKAVAVVSD